MVLHIAVEVCGLALLHEPCCVAFPLQARVVRHVEDVCVCDQKPRRAKLAKKINAKNTMLQSTASRRCARASEWRSMHGVGFYAGVCLDSFIQIAKTRDSVGRGLCI